MKKIEIGCNSNLRTTGRGSNINPLKFIFKKEMLEDLPPNGKVRDFENVASVKDMFLVQDMCKKVKKGEMKKEFVLEYFSEKYKEKDLLKYIERCMK